MKVTTKSTNGSAAIPLPVVTDGGEEPKYHERGLLRGMQILTAFSVEQPEHDLTSLSQLLHLPKGTLVRLLDCLRFAGFVETDSRTGKYRLGLCAFEIGCVYQQTATLDRIARPALTALAQTTGHSTNLGVLDQGQVLHVSVVLSPRPLRYDGYVGMRSDAHCSGLGKALLSEVDAEELRQFLRRHPLRRHSPNTITDPAALREALAETKRLGYAMDDEESAVGVRCVAAPIRTLTGATVAAVSATGPKGELEGPGLQSVVAGVIAAAREIGGRLGSATSAPRGRLAPV